MSEIKIKTSAIQILWFFCLRWLNRLLVFLSLRRSRRFWGIVYDSISKQPLDPVIVKLLYAESGEPIQTCVTDLAGRYGFLARPGKFKIFVKKSNYSFPSEKVFSDHDGIFTDIYRGEFFELRDESEVVGPNIPMDPIKPDWNQQAKLKVINTSPYLMLFLKKFVRALFWFGFLLVTIYCLKSILSDNRLLAWSWPKLFFLVYAFLIFINAVLPDPRLWGQIKNRRGAGLEGLFLELSNPRLAGITLAKSQSQEGGRFLLRANPGHYVLTIVSANARGSLPVRISAEGVINLNLKVDF